MKITVKNNSNDEATCDCGWKGEVQDAYWMHEEEYGRCPDCGSDEFIDYTWNRPEESEEEEISKWEWEWDGWKARLAVYGMMAGVLIFGLIPWIWGLIEEFKFVWNLLF